MKRLTSLLARPIRKLWRSERGVTAITVALLLPVLLGFTGFSLDIGHILQVQHALQASSDEAAMAGAKEIGASGSSSAISTATAYSSVSGGKNVISGVTASMVTGYPSLRCLTSTGVACSGSNSANAIQVEQTASVPTWFMRVMGIDSVTVTTTALAGASGGAMPPLDVMFIIDTTASMNDSDPNCSIAGATRETCALAGARTLLNELNPSVDYAGLMAFPGLKNAAQAPYDYECSGKTKPTTVSYASSPVYQVLGLQSNYKTSSAATSLNESADIVIALDGNSSCTGLTAVGGFGTYYAGVITAAQAALVANGQANAQKVIIFISDGGANASASNVPSGQSKNQCQEGITAAEAATTAGTWVYSIAYGSSTATGKSSTCTTDTSGISSCTTMQDIASQPQFFYSDTSGGDAGCTSSENSVSDLLDIFQTVGSSFSLPRLLPSNTT